MCAFHYNITHKSIAKYEQESNNILNDVIIFVKKQNWLVKIRLYMQ